MVWKGKPNQFPLKTHDLMLITQAELFLPLAQLIYAVREVKFIQDFMFSRPCIIVLSISGFYLLFYRSTPTVIIFVVSYYRNCIDC